MDLLVSAYSLVVGTIIPFLFVLTIVVFFHELGHFAVARWCNVKVDAFAVGFGREIFGWTRKGTRWKLCMIPLGGYVKFAGDENAASVPSRELIANMSEEERKTAFIAKPVWQRAAIVAAGPAGELSSRHRDLCSAVRVRRQAGLGPGRGRGLSRMAPRRGAVSVAGDVVKQIDGRDIQTFGELRQIVLMNANNPLVFEVERGGELVALTVTPDAKEKEVFLGERQMAGDIGLRGSADPENVIRIQYGPLGAIAEGARETWRIIDGTVSYIWGVITQRQSADQLGGPIRVAEISGQVADLGLIAADFARRPSCR